MAKRNRTHKLTPKVDAKPEVISVGLGRTGHRQHITGTGAHNSAPRRRRTRGAANRAAIREY